jgi:glycosyltransferase involved in cell wall biosynthesis
MFDRKSLVILTAPNVSEQMGGEAIKALQIFREIKKLHECTIQITHARCRSELVGRLNLSDVYFVEDTWLSIAIWRTKIFRFFLDILFARKALRLAEHIARERKLVGNSVIIHQTEPNSPVLPRFVSLYHSNIFGPINGNIYYPKVFRKDESLSVRLRRIFHLPAQLINRCLFHGKNSADAVLYAGGYRTRRSLEAAGYPERTMFESFDSGVKDEVLDRRRVEQHGENLRFVHFGRLVFHKGTALAIRALAKTHHAVCLDIIGRGPELENCKQLAASLSLDTRVRFLDWFPSHDELMNSLSQYRGVILPSIEDANGIVVQEAMALGLPAICLNWGGPQLLIKDKVSGFLIDPISKDYIVLSIARCLDDLAANSELAERISIAARAQAENWRWSKIVQSWLSMYDAIHSPIFE